MPPVKSPKVLKIDLLTLDAIIESSNLTFSGQPTSFTGHFMVESQFHSDPTTRAPFMYDGLDVIVGDYITTQESKVLKISAISYQDNDEVECTLEDEFALNGLTDANQAGESAMQTGDGLLFTTNMGLPVFYPLPGDIGSIQTSHLFEIQSRFQYLASPIDVSAVVGLQNQVNTLNTAVATLQTTVTLIQSDEQSENTTITAIQNQIASLQTSILALQADESSEELVFTAIQTQISNIQASIVELQSDEVAEELDLSSIHTAITNLQSNVSLLQTELVADQSEIAALHTSVNLIDNEITVLQTNVSANTSDISSLQTVMTAEQSALQAAQLLITNLQTLANTNAVGLANLIQSLAIVATTGSYTDLLNIPTSFNGAGTVRVYDFPASLQWVVQHNMNTRTFVPTLIDSNGNNFYANIQTVDANSFVVNLTDAASGKVNVYFP